MYLELELNNYINLSLFDPANSLSFKFLIDDYTNFEAFQSRYDDSKDKIEQSMLNINLLDILSKEQTHSDYVIEFE